MLDDYFATASGAAVTSAWTATAACLAAGPAFAARTAAGAAVLLGLLMVLLCFRDCCWCRCYWERTGSGLGEESPSRPPTGASVALCWAVAALRTHAWRICTGEGEALVALKCLKNQPVVMPLLVLRQEASSRQARGGKWRVRSCMMCIYLSHLNHQAGEDLPIQPRS